MLDRKLVLCGLGTLLAVWLAPLGAAQQGARDAGVSDQVQRAQSLYESGRASEALRIVDDVLERAAGDAEARFLKGLIYADMGRRNDAIEVFAALTADFPELPEPWNNLAVLFAENGEFDKARQALLAAIQTHPSYSTAHENLGDLYARMAGMAYDKALEQDRGNESARLKLSAVNGLFSVPTTPQAQAAVAQSAPASPPPAVSEPPPAPVAASRPEPEPEPEPVAVVPVSSPPPVSTPAASSPPASEPPPVTVASTRPEPVAQPPAVQPEPDPPAPDLAAAERAVATAVRRWAQAWSSQDVDGYLASYASSFRPSNGASRASWVRYRRDRLSAPSFIEVQVSDLDVTMRDATTAVARFTQGYRSDNYQDEVVKTLNMVFDDGAWRIAAEESESG